jgi:hypothetical protein
MGSVKAIIHRKKHKQLEWFFNLLPEGGCFYIALFLFLALGAGPLLGAASLRAQGPAAAPAAAPAAGPGPAKTIPEFRFTRHDRSVFANADLPGGRLALFVFFDPDCEHCQRTVRAMDRNVGSFRRVAVYFVSMAGQDKIDLFAASYAPRLRGLGTVAFLRDAGGQYMMRFNPIRFPSLYLYSSDKTLLDYEDNEDTLFRIERSIAAHAK